MNLRQIRHASGVPLEEVARRMGLRYVRSILRAESHDAHSTRYLSDMARSLNARLSITLTLQDGTVCPLDIPPPSRQEEGEPRTLYPEKFILRRKHKGLTAQDLAALAKVSYSNLSELENGKVTPTWSTLFKIGKVLGYSHNGVRSLVAAQVGRANSEEGVAILRSALVKFNRDTLDALLIDHHVRGVEAWLERRRGISDVTLDRLRRIKYVMDTYPDVTDEWLVSPNTALPGGVPPVHALKQYRDGLNMVSRLLAPSI